MIKSLHADDVVYANNVIVVNFQFNFQYFSEFKTTLQDDEKLQKQSASGKIIFISCTSHQSHPFVVLEQKNRGES